MRPPSKRLWYQIRIAIRSYSRNASNCATVARSAAAGALDRQGPAEANA